MLRWLAVSFLIILTCLARAQDNNEIKQPGWALMPTPAIDCNFANFAYYNCPLDTTLSLTRASAETVTWKDGHLAYAASGQLAISDLGLQVWESRTNDALYSNDLTQTGSWTATNITAAKNATGPDNIANSASTITASSAGGTILQAITLASQADTYSVYVKCVTCTGNIQIAEYPSGTPAFTTLTTSNCFNQAGVGTAPNTSTWVRCFGEATVLNPVVGFKIANSADSVQIFCNQLEPGAFESPCIPTTTVSATRAADNIAAAGVMQSTLSANQGWLFVYVIGSVQNQTSSAAYLVGGAGNNFLNANTSTTLRARLAAGTNLAATIGAGSFTVGPTGSAVAWNPAGWSAVANAGTVATTATAPATNAQAYIGSNSGTSDFTDGAIARLTAGNFRLPDPQLQMLTSLN